MRVFVTGGTGFIGKHLVRRLTSEKHDVICLVRKTSRAEDVKFLKSLGAKLHYGDIIKKHTLTGIDFDIVYHLAGILGDFKTKDETYHKINVIGTKNVLELCTSQKFIYCSSAGVLGPVTNGDESSKITPTNPYEKSKAEAESLVNDYDNHVIVRPEFVYGPYDMHVLPLFMAVRKNRFFLIGNGMSLLHPTYVDDVVECLVRSRKQKNQVFMVAGQKAVTVKEFAGLIASISCKRLSNIKVPLSLARLYVRLFEPLFRMTSVNPVLSSSRIDFFTKSRSFCTQKAKDMLNYSPVMLEDGLRLTIDWYEKNNYL